MAYLALSHATAYIMRTYMFVCHTRIRSKVLEHRFCNLYASIRPYNDCALDFFLMPSQALPFLPRT